VHLKDTLQATATVTFIKKNSSPTIPNYLRRWKGLYICTTENGFSSEDWLSYKKGDIQKRSTAF